LVILPLFGADLHLVGRDHVCVRDAKGRELGLLLAYGVDLSQPVIQVLEESLHAGE